MLWFVFPIWVFGLRHTNECYKGDKVIISVPTCRQHMRDGIQFHYLRPFIFLELFCIHFLLYARLLAFRYWMNNIIEIGMDRMSLTKLNIRHDISTIKNLTENRKSNLCLWDYIMVKYKNHVLRILYFLNLYAP